MLCCEPIKDDVTNAPVEPVATNFKETEFAPLITWYDDDIKFFEAPDLPKLRRNIEPLKSK
jgi:hypothetical protein